MSKLLIVRQSGRPVSEEAQQKYDAEFRIMYDACEERAKLIAAKPNSRIKATTMAVLQRLLRYAERQLFKRHATNIYVSLPRSEKAWTALIAGYEDVPIMVARRTNGKGVVMVLMDTLRDG